MRIRRATVPSELTAQGFLDAAADEPSAGAQGGL
jgi:hypothetical protein